MKLQYARLLLVLGLSGLSIAKDVCKRISDGEIVDGVSEQEINDCYACKGWHKVEEGTAYSVLQSLPDREVVYQQEYQWCGETADDKFEVIFRRPIKLAGFTIRASEPDAWVKELEVWYGDDSNELSRARNAAAGEVFYGNVNERTTKENKFAPPITATFIRIVPKSYESRPCFRINFYSCKKQRYAAPEPPMIVDPDFLDEEMESDEMGEEDYCPPLECDNKCLVFLEDDYGCNTCACDRTNSRLFEGDIRVDSSTIEAVETAYGIRNVPEGIMRAGIASDIYRWMNYPSDGNYIIPYVLDGSLSDTAIQLIPPALQEFEDATCLQFRERSDDDEEEYYLKFFNGSGCWSYVGNIWRKPGGQEISIGKGCENKGIIQHEVLHALGFWHEQSRSDRDQYVNILTQNIIQDRLSNFNKQDDSRNFSSPYDFNSVMHYGKKAFSANGSDTIQAISDASMLFGQRMGFSVEDIKQLHSMYECPGTAVTTLRPCVNLRSDYYCEIIKNNGYCIYTSYWGFYCPKECGACTDTVTTTPMTTTPMTTTTTITTIPTTTTATTTTQTTTTPPTTAPTTTTPPTTTPTTTTPTTTTPTTTTPTTTTQTTTTSPTTTPTTTTTTTTTTTATTTPTTTKATTITPCTDRRRRRRCRKWRRRGYCNRKSVKRRCAKTCGLCV